MTTSTREEILVAALAVLSEGGYRKTSIDAVAERAGLTRQGVLHYFPSKKLLLLAVIQRRHELNRAHLLQHGDKDWPSQLAEVVAFEERNPGLAELHNVLMAESVTGNEAARQYFHAHYQVAHEQIVAQFEERYGEHLPSGLTPRTAATALLAMLDGIQLQWMLDREQTDHPRIMREVWSVLLGPTGTLETLETRPG